MNIILLFKSAFSTNKVEASLNFTPKYITWWSFVLIARLDRIESYSFLLPHNQYGIVIDMFYS